MGKKRTVSVFSLGSVKRMLVGLKAIGASGKASTVIVCPRQHWFGHRTKLRKAAPQCKILFAKNVNDVYEDGASVEFASAIWKSKVSIIVTEGAPVRSIKPILDMSVRMSKIRRFQIVA